MTTAEKIETDPALITCERCGHQAQYSVECDHGSTGTAAPSATSGGPRGGMVLSMAIFSAMLVVMIGFIYNLSLAYGGVAEEEREVVEEKYEQYLPERLKEEG